MLLLLSMKWPELMDSTVCKDWFSYGTSGSKQDNTLSQRRCCHDIHPNQIPCVEETMWITELLQFILQSCIQSSAVLPGWVEGDEWLGDWKKGKLYCTIHIYIPWIHKCVIQTAVWERSHKYTRYTNLQCKILQTFYKSSIINHLYI